MIYEFQVQDHDNQSDTLKSMNHFKQVSKVESGRGSGLHLIE